MIAMRTIVPKPINMGILLVSAGLETVGGAGSLAGQDDGPVGPVV